MLPIFRGKNFEGKKNWQLLSIYVSMKLKINT